jgi:predicted acyl esterase
VGGERGKKGKISELRWMEVSLHFLSLIHTHTRTHQIQHKYRFAVIPDQTLSFFSLTSLHSHQDRKDGARGTTVGTKRSEGESRNKVSSMEWTLATHTHTHTARSPNATASFHAKISGSGIGSWIVDGRDGIPGR